MNNQTMNYRKIGKLNSHTLVERMSDHAIFLCCTSASQYGGVSVTEPALDRFNRLPRSPKFVLLRSMTGKWAACMPLDDLPYMIANEGRIGNDGRPWPDYRIYDREDVPADTEVDPGLIECLDQLESRRLATIPF